MARPVEAADITALRAKQKRNLMATLLFFWVRLLDYVVAAPFALDHAQSAGSSVRMLAPSSDAINQVAST